MSREGRDPNKNWVPPRVANQLRRELACLDEVPDASGEPRAGEGLAIGDVIAERFEVQRRLDAGGMGAVYVAWDRRVGVQVALKVARGADPTALRRFQREAEVLASLEHPGIVRHVAHGVTSSGLLYLAMDLLHGQSLDARLSEGPLAIGECIALGAAVAEALAAAHARSAVHRDVKPANLFLVGGRVRDVRVLDFGLVRTHPEGSSLTHAGSVMGTPGYMAPEQVRGESVDGRADLFSLGCVLYECATGAPAFRGNNLSDALVRVLLEDPARPSRLRRDIPAALEELILRMLAKRADGRPARAEVIAADLRRLQQTAGPAAPHAQAPSSGGGDAEPTTVRRGSLPGDPPRRERSSGSLSAGQIVAGKYELLHRLRRGPSGALWVARHRDLAISVVLKFLPPAALHSRESQARFQREARAAARLRSGHVVRVLDHGVDEGRAYLAMELLEGEDLAQRLEREGRLPLEPTASLVRQAAVGLGCAHEAGVVHRDLNPANVFIAREGDAEVIKILDFGLARASEPGPAEELTHTDCIVGTPEYMSPEQARDARTADARSDVWSLAMIAFRAIVGRTPFADMTPGDVVTAVRSGPTPLPSRWAPDSSAAVDGFFARAFAPRVDQRFQSAREMADALDQVAQAGSAAALDAAETLPFAEAAGRRPALPRTSTRRRAVLLGAASLMAACVIALVSQGGFDADAPVREEPRSTAEQPSSLPPDPEATPDPAAPQPAPPEVTPAPLPAAPTSASVAGTSSPPRSSAAPAPPKAGSTAATAAASGRPAAPTATPATKKPETPAKKLPDWGL